MEDKEIIEEIKQDFKTHEETHKQIEKMANIIENSFKVYFGANDLVDPEDFQEQAKDLAQELLKCYQPNLSEDNMIISRQEYEALKLIESYHIKSCGKDTITLSKTELEALTGAFVDSTAKLVNKSTKDLADKIYQLSEEWGGGVAFYNQARKLCIEHGAEVD